MHATCLYQSYHPEIFLSPMSSNGGMEGKHAWTLIGHVARGGAAGMACAGV